MTIELTLEVLPDPRRDVLLVRYETQGRTGSSRSLPLTWAAPAATISAWMEDGRRLCAARGDVALCLAADPPLDAPELRLCRRLGRLAGPESPRRADLRLSSAPRNGTVALTRRGPGSAAACWRLASAESARGARTLVRTALADGFEALRAEFLQAWQHWGAQLQLPRPNETLGDAGLLSAAVLKIHEDRTYPGRRGRQPQRALGQQHRHARRLPPGVAARCHAHGLCAARGKSALRMRATSSAI